MNIKKGNVILLLFMILFAISIPIVWLTLQAGSSATFLTPIVILTTLVIVTIIINKTSYKPYQQPYQHKRAYTVKRIERAMASGAIAVLAIGFITKSLRPLFPYPFWGIYLIILFVIGATIEDTLQRIL
jgi:hypothetical protein